MVARAGKGQPDKGRKLDPSPLARGAQELRARNLAGTKGTSKIAQKTTAPRPYQFSKSGGEDRPFNDDAKLSSERTFVTRRSTPRAAGGLLSSERQEKEGTYSKVTPEKAAATNSAQATRRKNNFDFGARSKTSSVKRDELKAERGQRTGRQAVKILRTRLSAKKKQTEDD